MPAEIISGTALADDILKEARQKISSLGEKPSLAILMVGDDNASKMYAQMKQRVCAMAGINPQWWQFRENAREQEVIDKIQLLNADKGTNGILVQLPLPQSMDRNNILRSISPAKDVDGLTPLNLGLLALGVEGLVSCTPLGIIKLIESTGAKIEGKNCCIVNHSVLIGRPLSQLLLNRNATVAVCHKFTKNLSEFTQKADILITAAGVPGLITREMVKGGAIVIDAGIARKDGRVSGDVDFDGVKEVAGFITPVPGGVGPMTIACLILNTVKAAEIQRK